MRKCYMDGFPTKLFGKDPARETTRNGKTYIRFGFNSADRRKDENGKWQSIPQYFECVYWGRDEDPAIDAIEAQKRMMLVCEPTQETWEKDGKKQSKTVFKVFDAWASPEFQASESGAEDGLYDSECPF